MSRRIRLSVNRDWFRLAESGKGSAFWARVALEVKRNKVRSTDLLKVQEIIRDVERMKA